MNFAVFAGKLKTIIFCCFLFTNYNSCKDYPSFFVQKMSHLRSLPSKIVQLSGSRTGPG